MADGETDAVFSEAQLRAIAGVYSTATARRPTPSGGMERHRAAQSGSLPARSRVRPPRPAM